MIRSKDRVDLSAQEHQKIANFEAVPSRRVGREIGFGKSKEPHRRVQSSPILGMSWPEVLLLQMNKTSRRLNQTFEVIGIIRFGAQPEMLEDVVRFVVTLFIPAAKETEIAGMPRNFLRCGIHRHAAQFLNQP